MNELNYILKSIDKFVFIFSGFIHSVFVYFKINNYRFVKFDIFSCEMSKFCILNYLIIYMYRLVLFKLRIFTYVLIQCTYIADACVLYVSAVQHHFYRIYLCIPPI